MHSLRSKISAVTIGSVLVAILCVFLASASILRGQSDRLSVETMDAIAKDTSKSLEKYTESVEQSVENIASVAVDSLDSTMLVKGGVVGPDTHRSERSAEQTQALDSYLKDYSAELQKACATVASHTQGIITYYYCMNPELCTSPMGFFYSKLGKTGFWENDNLDARDFDASDQQHYMWYFEPIRRGRPSWVGPYTAHFLNEMEICSYLVPIYKSGVFVGVLGMDIPVDTFISQVSSVHVYEDGFASLLDAEGKVIYHPDRAYGSVAELPGGIDVMGQHDSTGELIRYNARGAEQQMAFTTLSNDMKLIIVAPTAQIDVSTYQLLRTILLITFGIVCSLTVVAMVLMRHITQPLERLTAASRRLAAADYDVELDYTGDDEIGALTTSFMQMRDQLQDYIEGLSRRAVTDDLTGLPNQRHFFDLAEKECTHLVGAGKSPVLIYFNLVGMKNFNRRFGFDEGDRLIIEFAQIIADQFGTQLTGRFGQDHFAVVSDEEVAEASIREVFARFQHANGDRSLPVSVGMYPYSMGEVEVSVACDRAKYACDQRRGTYVSGMRRFDGRMLAEARAARYVIGNLDQALSDGWVQVYYQPIVRASTGEVCDEEALSRWIDPTRGFMSPADFVPALENAGIIYRLDLYVLDCVLEKIRTRQEAGLRVVAQSVNLSRSDFAACDMVEEIRSRVDAAGVARDLITIEITESILGQSYEYMKEQVERFQSLGFPVWMDDFGSGYSSLDVLRDIRFDVIKFDMSFMQKLDEGENGTAILTRMMQMAIDLGVETVCEGVETEEQRDLLCRIGCSKLQGYLFGRPEPYQE